MLLLLHLAMSVLAEPTGGGWLAPSLCLPTYLSGPVPVWSKMPADSLALFYFLFLSFSLFSFSLMTGMDGLNLPPLLFHLYLTPPFLSLYTLCTTTTPHVVNVLDIWSSLPLSCGPPQIRSVTVYHSLNDFWEVEQKQDALFLEARSVREGGAEGE